MFYTDITLHRGQIYFSGYESGKKFIKQEDFKPTLAIECNEDLGWTTIYGQNVKHINFDSITEFNEYKKNFSDVFEFHGNISPIYQFIGDKFPDKVKYNNKDIKIFLYDIETIDETGEFKGFPKPEDAPVEVVSVSIKNLKDNKTYLFSLRDWNESESIKNVTITGEIIHEYFETEVELLKFFCNFFAEECPDVLVGYNNKIFDDPYMLNRIDSTLGKTWLNKLSPIGVVNFKFKTNEQGIVSCNYSIKGLQIFDFLELYKKFSQNSRESYKLSFIAQYELEDDKIEYEEYDNIRDFYLQNPQKFQDYNLNDTELIYKLDKKLGYFDLVCTIAYISKINLEDVMSPIKTWDSIIYDFLSNHNIVIPPGKNARKEDFPGAYVHPPVPGIYDWVVSFDLNSLYPHEIIQHNISPETIIEGERLDVSLTDIDEKYFDEDFRNETDWNLSGAGYYFSKEIKGFLPKLMETYYNDRKEIKRQMMVEKKKKNGDKNLIARLNNEQLAKKINLNSAYGMLSSVYCRYFDLRLATAITLSARLAVKWKAIKVDEFFQKKFKLNSTKWIFSDTDSAYFCLDFIANKFPDSSSKEIVNILDKFCETVISPEIERNYVDLAERLNAGKNVLKSEREVITEKYLITGKKRYCCLVWDDEGVRYDKPKLKVTGIEIVRSSTPNAIKPYMKDSIKVLMKRPDKIIEFVNKVRIEFNKMSPEEIAFPRSVSNVKKYTDKTKMFKKGTPIGVRAAILYNNYIEEYDLDSEKIFDGDKIKFFYALVPNIFYNENVFGYINKIPNREEIIKFIDYNTQFNKVYFDVIKNICKVIGIDLKKVETTKLDELF